MVRKLNRPHGVKRSGMELRCMVWSEEVWYGVKRCGMELRGLVWSEEVWYEVKRSGIKVEYTNIVS